jgi:hypothetical protein
MYIHGRYSFWIMQGMRSRFAPIPHKIKQSTMQPIEGIVETREHTEYEKFLFRVCGGRILGKYRVCKNTKASDGIQRKNLS